MHIDEVTLTSTSEHLNSQAHQLNPAEADDDPLPFWNQGSLLSRSVPASQIQQLSPAALAYLGDAVYELYIRRYFLTPPKRLQTYHHQVVAQVRAESQASHLQSLLPYLTHTELELLKRGRNAAVGRPKRVEPHVYQQATSLETLIGYLYLTDLPRLTHLLTKLEINLPVEL